VRLVLTWKLSSTVRLGIDNQISSVVSPANDPWFQLETWCAEFSKCSVVKLLAPHCQKYHLKTDKWEHKEMHAYVNYTEALWDITWKVWKRLQLLICRPSEFHFTVLELSDLDTSGCGVAAATRVPCTWSASSVPCLLVHLSTHPTSRYMSVWSFWDILNH